MIFHQKLHRQFFKQNSFWKEQRYIFRNTQIEQGKEREDPYEKEKDTIRNMPTALLAFYGDNEKAIPRKWEANDHKYAMEKWSEDLLDSLDHKFVRATVLAEGDKGFMKRFNSLFRDEEREEDVKKYEQQEIQEILKELGINKASEEGMIDIQNFHKVVKAKNTEEDREAEFKDYLKRQYINEQQGFSEGFSTESSRRIEQLETKISSTIDNFPGLESNKDFQEKFFGGLENIKKDRNTLLKSFESYEFDSLKEKINTQKTGSVRDEFEDILERRINSRRESGVADPEKISNLERKEIWERVLIQRLAKERRGLADSLKNFEAEIIHLQGSLIDIEKFLKEYRDKPVEDIAEEVAEKVGGEEKIQRFFHPQANSKLELKNVLQKVLEPEEEPLDPMTRAVKAANFVNKVDTLVEALKKSGQQDKSPEEWETEEQEHRAREERSEAEAKNFDGDVSKIEKTYEEANKILQAMQKNYVQNIQFKDNKGVIIKESPNTSLDDKNKTTLAANLQEFNNEIKLGQSNLEAAKEYKTPEQLRDMFARSKTILDEIRKQDTTVKEFLESKAGQQTPIQIRMVAPVAVWETIKDIAQIFLDEAEHYDKTSAAIMEQQAGGLLKHLPGFVGQRFDLAEKKGQIKKENLDAEERGEFKYENHDNSGVLQAFESWNDGNEQHLRALLEEMGKRGLIRWEDQRLWKHLTSLTGQKVPDAARFDDRLRDDVLQQMFITAFGDKDWFRNQKSANIQGSVSKYEEQMPLAKGFETDGTTAQKLASILEEHYNVAYNDNNKDLNRYGQLDRRNLVLHHYDSPEVNTDLFTAILINAIDSQAIAVEDKFFYIVRGIASGLVSLEFLTHLEDKGFFNKWPLLNVLRKQSFQGVCDMDRKMTGVGEGGDVHNSWDEKVRADRLFVGNKKLIHDYIHNEMSINDGILDRMGRIVEKWNEVDKDVMHETLNKLPPSAIDNLFDKFSGRPSMSVPGMKNGIMGWSSRLSSFSIDKDDEKRVEKIEHIRNSLSMFMMFDGGIRGRTNKDLDKKDGALALSDADYHSKAGMDASGLTVFEFANITKNFLRAYLDLIGKEKIQKVTDGMPLSEVKVMLFDDNYADKGKDDKEKAERKKKQAVFIRKFSEKIFVSLLDKAESEEAKKLEFLIDRWNKEGAFASYYDTNNAVKTGATQSYEGMSDTLKATQKDFNKWTEGSN